MFARFVFLFLIAVLTCWPRTVSGAAVIVPDDYPTIGAAIGSGADTIRVRDGVYDEIVVIPRPLLLARDGPGLMPIHYPNVTGLVIAGGPEGRAHVAGLRFLQEVQLTGAFSGLDVWLDGCILEAGITRGPSLGQRLRVTGCALSGLASVYPWSLEFTGNTVTNGALNADYEDYATIAGNRFSGAPGFAITLGDNDCHGTIADNRVTDCGGGIRVRDACATRIERDTIESCAGNGIEVAAGGTRGDLDVVDNVLRDLGGNGIAFGPLGGRAIGNTIERVALAGIRLDVSTAAAVRIAGNRVTDAGEAGVLTGGTNFVQALAGNTILRAGGPGALLHGPVRADSNVIGRCRGDGLRVLELAGYPGSFGAAHNTLYLNDGNGLAAELPGAGAVVANIGYGNAGWGLDWLGSGIATLSCNLGFGNFAGNVRGAEPGADDREGNPLFCDLPADDVSLGPGSAAILEGCETAGALGPGCSEAVGVAGAAPVAALRAGPLPARACVRFEWAAGAPAHLEVFDMSGARRWERWLAAGPGALVWDLRDQRGRPLAPGVYLARATSAGRTSTVKLVVRR